MTRSVRPQNGANEVSGPPRAGLASGRSTFPKAVLAFYRLSRGLKNAALLRDLTWERLSTLSVVARREPVSISELSVVEAVTAPTIGRATLEKGMARTLERIAEMLGRLDPADLEAMADLIRRARDSKTR